MKALKPWQLGLYLGRKGEESVVKEPENTHVCFGVMASPESIQELDGFLSLQQSQLVPRQYASQGNTYCGLIPWQAQMRFFPPGILSSGQDNLPRAGEVAQLVEHLPRLSDPARPRWGTPLIPVVQRERLG